MDKTDLIIALPGRQFSNKFLNSWSALLGYLFDRKIQFKIINKYSSNVYYVRNMCLGGEVLAGKDQLPYQGQLDYKYILWIDSDIVFNPEQVFKLLNIAIAYDKVKIISGLYKMEDAKSYATVIDWDEEYFLKHGSFQFLDDNVLNTYDKNTLMEVSYTGFGFILIKKGVFETIGYPWFRPHYFNFGDKAFDFCSEDVGFCRSVLENNYKIYVDPSIIVGHEKPQVL